MPQPFPMPTTSATPAALPMLRLGSIGDSVRMLQGALNVWPRSALPPLKTDGNFGPKTDGKVREFQSGNQLASDGVVGPWTWAQLEPLIAAITQTVPLPKDDPALGERIKQVAEYALGMAGWRESDTPSPANPRIAAALCAGNLAGVRARQGGAALQQMMMIAEVGGSVPGRCPTITADAERWWQNQTKAGTDWRNNNDLPAWCGIFCIYVYRCAGINVPGGWSQHKQNVNGGKVYRIGVNPKNVLPGTIGVVDGYGGRNHHFIVTANTDSVLYSIDGNSFGPNANDKSQGVKSVIARNSYTYGQLKAEKAYFLFPVIA